MRKTPGTLTTTLAAITTQVDSLTNSRAPPEQPGTSAVENHPTAAFSAIPDSSMEEQVRMQVEQQMRSSHPSLAITDNEMDGDEDQLPATRRSSITSGKLRSADTTAIKKVLWLHELVFTPEGQPAVYKSLSAMAFINGYLTIMSLLKDSLRYKMAVHLQEIEDGETFGWPVVRVYNTVWLQHLEQGRATWNDEVTRLKLRWALVLHRIAPSPQPSATPATNTPQAPTRAPR